MRAFTNLRPQPNPASSTLLVHAPLNNIFRPLSPHTPSTYPPHASRSMPVPLAPRGNPEARGGHPPSQPSTRYEHLPALPEYDSPADASQPPPAGSIALCFQHRGRGAAGRIRPQDASQHRRSIPPTTRNKMPYPHKRNSSDSGKMRHKPISALPSLPRTHIRPRTEPIRPTLASIK
jgi:hypothetical protein